MPRFVALALPELRLELARRRAGLGAEPLAIVVARPGGAVKDETSLLGNTRLDDVSAEARTWGVAPGQTLAAARARLADLRVRVLPLEAAREALVSLAEIALAFGATTAFALEPCVVWADITGCAHLHASSNDPAGERTLAERLAEKVRGLGHACRIAVADGPQVAAAMACFAPAPEAHVPCIVAGGASASALALLPLEALPLTDELCAWLRHLGVCTVGQLQRMPPGALATRVGPGAPRLLALLRGEDREPLTPHVPPELVEERAELEYGAESTEALLFVARRLVQSIEARLSARGLFATQLELVLRLDRAFSPQQPELTLPLCFPEPLRDAAALLSVLRIRLEATKLPAPVREVRLRAPTLSSRPARPQELFEPAAKAERHLPRLAAELLAELGPERVGTLALRDAWLPRSRVQLVPAGARPTTPSRASWLGEAPEPLRRLATPRPYTPSSVVRPLVRAEGLEWWKGRSAGPFDWGAEWLAPLGALAWVQLDPKQGRAWLVGWVDG